MIGRHGRGVSGYGRIRSRRVTGMRSTKSDAKLGRSEVSRCQLPAVALSRGNGKFLGLATHSCALCHTQVGVFPSKTNVFEQCRWGFQQAPSFLDVELHEVQSKLRLCPNDFAVSRLFPMIRLDHGFCKMYQKRKMVCAWCVVKREQRARTAQVKAE